MNSSWIVVAGLALFVVLGAVIAKRLPPEYRRRRTPTIGTVAATWAFLGIHFTLVVFALFNSTWHVHLPAALGAGAGVLLTAVGAAMYLSAVYAYRFAAVVSIAGPATTGAELVLEQQQRARSIG